MKRTLKWLLALNFVALAPMCTAARAQDAAAQSTTAAANAKTQIKKAVDFLRTQQATDGSFSAQTGVGPTALVASLCAVVCGCAVQDPVVAKAIAYLLKHEQADGGIYATGSRHQNYDSCIALVALSKANKDGKYSEQLKKLEAFIKKQQWDEGENQKPNDAFYGARVTARRLDPICPIPAFLVEALHD